MSLEVTIGLKIVENSRNKVFSLISYLSRVGLQITNLSVSLNNQNAIHLSFDRFNREICLQLFNRCTAKSVRFVIERIIKPSG